MRGFCDMGNYTLKTAYDFARLKDDEVDFPDTVYNPDDIVKLVKSEIVITRPPNDRPSTDTLKSKPDASQHDNLPDHDQSSDIENDVSRPTETETDTLTKKYSSQTSLATKVLTDNAITLVPSMGAFVIKGSKESKYAVTLFPKETCQCPSRTECYHIIPAKKAIGMSTESRSKLNLTELRKRSRKRVDKKSGRKNPD